MSRDSYYYEAVGIAKKLGIVKGGGDNRFQPDEAISWQDMMVIAARGLSLQKKTDTAGKSSDLDIFTDRSDVAEYAVEAVAGMVKEGLVKGDNVRINPLGITTRAEAAVLIYRIFTKYTKMN